MIRDPGSRGQKGTGSRIRIRNTAQNFTQPCGGEILLRVGNTVQRVLHLALELFRLPRHSLWPR
jgi:hypothetical protein